MDERFLIVRLFFSGKNARHDSWLINMSAIYEMLGAKMMHKSLQRPKVNQEHANLMCAKKYGTWRTGLSDKCGQPVRDPVAQLARLGCVIANLEFKEQAPPYSTRSILR